MNSFFITRLENNSLHENSFPKQKLQTRPKSIFTLHLHQILKLQGPTRERHRYGVALWGNFCTSSNCKSGFVGFKVKVCLETKQHYGLEDSWKWFMASFKNLRCHVHFISIHQYPPPPLHSLLVIWKNSSFSILSGMNLHYFTANACKNPTTIFILQKHTQARVNCTFLSAR